jgi:hypothetical protein
MDLVTTGTAFSIAQYPLQPGVGTLFPWLSVIAQRFNRYRFNRLQFLYEAKCSSQSAGSVILAVDADASDQLPATKSEVCSYQMFKDYVPWVSGDLVCNCVDLNANLPYHFVRSGTTANTDIKTYDSGNFILATGGIAAGTYGELYVSYDVELDTPILTDGVGGSLTAGGTPTQANPLGVPVVSGILPGVWTPGVFTFNQQFEGVLSFAASGTPGAQTVTGGTATVTWKEASTSTAAAVVSVVVVRALIGQTVTWTSANVPSPGITLVFASAPYDSI